MPGLACARRPVRPAFSQRLFQFITLKVQGTKLKFLHVCQRGIANVVHDDIKQDANAALMRLINKLTQVILGAHVGIERCPVLGVVAVVGIMREITFGSAAYPAVDLLKRGAYPERIHSQLLQVIELAGQPLQIATVERANLLHAVFVAAIAVVVARVAIHIAVGQYKIDGGILPAKRCRLVGFGALKQQQAVTVGGWLQGDFPILYGRRLFTVVVAHDGAFREDMADVQRQRLTVPLRTLADNVGHRLFCRALNCQQ